ncbi:MAG: oligosaccharide flippase family protein, partial [Lentisphaeria bacterium]
MESSAKRRLLKNSIMLYVRMALMMVIGLYTSRVVLQTLGVEDFGIYNVVGGVVVLFSFLTSAMQSATQRFLNIELGKKDLEQARRVFVTALNVHLILSGVIFILAETIGLWFLNVKLNIPIERMVAANWVYQFSIFTTVISIVTMPYMAAIIAHERMDFYAWQSVISGILRLVIVYLLGIFGSDKLIIYAILVFVVTALTQFFAMWYCGREFMVTHYKRFWDRDLFREMFAFSSWSLFGGIGNMANSQGVSMVMNMFCG